MNLTEALKKWLVDNGKAKADASDDEFRKTAAAALVDGSLDSTKLAELLADKKEVATAAKASDLSEQLKSLTVGLGEAVTMMKQQASAGNDGASLVDGPPPEPNPAKKKEPEKKEPSAIAKMIVNIGAGLEAELTELGGRSHVDIRVKNATERYSDTKSAMVYPDRTTKGMQHPKAGRPVMDFDEGGGAIRAIDNPSELDMAVVGAWGKMLCATAQHNGLRSQGFAVLPPHDKELLYHAMTKMRWGGASDGGMTADIKNEFLTAAQQKAIIDDAVSGGLEAAPIVFDDRVIQRPLLHGELFPLVNTTPLDRGRRIEGVSIGTVTGSWGGIDNTAIALFNTNSYVSAFDTTIFRWNGAIEIGRDFLSDSPIDFGSILTTQYGQRLLEDLDDVIAAGNGTTQPEGIINKTGATSIAFGGTTSLGNYESLRFGVAKNEHQADRSSAVFCGTETSYQRAVALPVGAADARRLGGMDYDSYRWMQRPYKINESLIDQQIFYAIMSKYRMFRRRGLTIQTSTEGSDLLRSNLLLMIAVARYGGQQERGATCAITTDAPA